ncbi:Alpha-glucosidase 2, partial [Linum grandiflorum]
SFFSFRIEVFLSSDISPCRFRFIIVDCLTASSSHGLDGAPPALMSLFWIVIRHLAEIEAMIQSSYCQNFLCNISCLHGFNNLISLVNEESLVQVAKAFREKDIPYDVIWMDIEYTEGFRCFTFDQALYCQHYSCLSGEVWPGPSVFPDFTQFRSWWASLVREFVSNGVDGIWNDMNEPSVFKGLSGQPLSGPDLGVFAGNPTPKLFGRWMGIDPKDPCLRKLENSFLLGSILVCSSASRFCFFYCVFRLIAGIELVLLVLLISFCFVFGTASDETTNEVKHVLPAGVWMRFDFDDAHPVWLSLRLFCMLW